MREAWGEWAQHRREIKKKLTPLATRRQLAALEDMGEAKAIAAIQHSIANGWQGIFEPQEKKNGNRINNPGYDPITQHRTEAGESIEPKRRVPEL
jgi:hypothetical protein